MASFRQANFSGGEIAPALTGRNDVEKYAIALKTCRNMIPTPWGNCLNRPGTEYLGGVQTHAKRVRLIPFIYSDTDAYILEFGDVYIRVWKNGVELGATITGTIPYTEAGLPYIKFAQVGDVLWLSQKDVDVATLTRFSDTAWTLATVAYVPTAAYFNDGRPVLYSVNTGDATHPAREWIWKVTAIAQDSATGRTFETNPFTIAGLSSSGIYPAYAAITSNYWYVAPDAPAVLKWNYVSGATYQPSGYNSYRILSWRVYRGRGSLFGFLGEMGTTSATKEFTDSGDEPDYTQQPPEGRNPFQVFNSAGSIVRTEQPNALAFFEQRLGNAGTTERPGWVWLSALNSYTSFDKHMQVLEDDAVEFELASLRREEIRSMVGLDKLFLFSSGGVWTLAGNGGPLTAYSLQAIKQTDDGATWLDPLVVRDALIYVRSKGVGVNLLDYEQGRDKYSITDLTTFARHFFDAQTIVDWCYAHDPFNVIWAVRSDGALLSLTFNRSLGVWGWALHETDGLVENICAIPEGTEDAVYMVVRRTIDGNVRRFVERLTSRAVSDVAEGVFLDCAKLYEPDDYASFDDLGHLEGETVTVVADGVVLGDYEVASGTVILEDTLTVASRAYVGVRYAPKFELLDLSSPKQDIRGIQKQVTSVTVDVENSSGLWVGQTFDNMTEWRSRSVSASYEAVPLQTRQVKINVNGTWNTGGRACLELRDPVALNIIGVSREVVTGGD